MDKKSIETLLKKELGTPHKGLLELADYLASDYTIGGIESYYTNYDENTRFVIVEKYPEKEKFDLVEGLDGVYMKTLHYNIELIPPPEQIEVNITINKDGTIEPGI